LTAQEFHTEFVSSSIVFTSGSTKFGDTTDDLHSMTGSLVVAGDNLTIDSVGGVSGSATSTGSFGALNATKKAAIGDSLASSAARLLVHNSGQAQSAIKIEQDQGYYGLEIDQDGNNAAIYIDSEATTNSSIYIAQPANTGGSVLMVDGANSLTTGRILYLGSNSSDTSTRNLVELVNEHASATGATCLQIRNDSTGTGINFEGGGFALSGSYQSTGSFGRGGLKVGLEGPPQLQGNINGSGIDIAASTFPQLFFHNSTSGYGNEDGTRLTYEGHHAVLSRI